MGDDMRASEMEMLQAMYGGDGEFVQMPDDEFSCTLRPTQEGAQNLELEVTLPEGYPTVSPALRIICDVVARAGMDALNEGMAAVLEENAGEQCMTIVVEWLLENLPQHIQAIPQEEVVAPESAEPAHRGQRNGTKCTMWDERGDLFEVGADWALCHCVSKDLDMSAGIAVTFKKVFSGVEDLKRQQIDVGGCGVLQKKGRYVYYLVTKNKHGGKPNMQTLRASLEAMRTHVQKNGVKRLAMPKIGCGLDRLSWGAVQELVLEVFDDVEVELCARSL